VGHDVGDHEGARAKLVFDKAQNVRIERLGAPSKKSRSTCGGRSRASVGAHRPRESRRGPGDRHQSKPGLGVLRQSLAAPAGRRANPSARALATPDESLLLLEMLKIVSAPIFSGGAQDTQRS